MDASARLARITEGTERGAGRRRPALDGAFAALRRVVRRDRPAAGPRRATTSTASRWTPPAARYATLDDTLDYCYHVAGVVGLMMAWVMGVRDRAAL